MIKAIRDAIRMDDIAHDPWGTSQGWRFGIARVLHACDPSLVPDEWQYQPGASTSTERFRDLVNAIDDENAEHPDIEIAEMLYEEEVTVEDLVRAGNDLARFSALCKLYGRDY